MLIHNEDKLFSGYLQVYNQFILLISHYNLIMNNPDNGIKLLCWLGLVDTMELIGLDWE